MSSRIETVGGTKVGYVRLAQFTKGSADALAEAVEGLREKGATALVFDLRGDPGGLVNEAVGVAGVFLPDDSTVVVSQGLHSPRHVFRTDGTPAAGDLPLVVLVNRGSASSSEIVAGALRDAGRGELVGQRTFGKALIQSTEPLRDGGALKLTTARYLTPKGFDLAKRGLPPDVRVADDPGTPKDEMLAAGPGAGGRRVLMARARGGPAETLVCELVPAGRGAAAQPAFEPGQRIPLAKGARGAAEVGDLVVVTMRGRAGRVAEVLGPASSPRTALAGLLASEGLARPFPRAALREADEADDSAVAADPGRRDLRDQRVITIDPEGAKDHDDAIAVASEAGGATRLWVHIADVSRFVPAGSALDREAARRGNSVYVPGVGRADAARAALVGPLQPAPRRRPRGGDGRDGRRRRRPRWGRRASRAR